MLIQECVRKRDDRKANGHIAAKKRRCVRPNDKQLQVRVMSLTYSLSVHRAFVEHGAFFVARFVTPLPAPNASNVPNNLAQRLQVNV